MITGIFALMCIFHLTLHFWNEASFIGDPEGEMADVYMVRFSTNLIYSALWAGCLIASFMSIYWAIPGLIIIAALPIMSPAFREF